MTLDKLNYLIVLAEEQNVTHAAQRLFITQPTLTAFVNKIEREVGFRIFDRTRNPVLLTHSGKQYLEQMRRLVTEEMQMVEALRVQENARQTIRIGIGQIHSQMWIPLLMTALLEKYPDLNIQVREGAEMNLMELLRAEEIDLLMGHLEIDTVNFHFEPLCEEQLSLVIPENLMPADMLEKCRDSGCGQDQNDPILIDPKILYDLPLIHPSKMQGLFLNMKQLLDHYHIHPAQTIQTSNMITAAGMVQRGLGYMYMAPVLFNYTKVPDPKRLYYCTLPHLMQTRKFYIGYQKGNPNLEVIEKIREIMRDIV